MFASHLGSIDIQNVLADKFGGTIDHGDARLGNIGFVNAIEALDVGVAGFLDPIEVK